MQDSSSIARKLSALVDLGLERVDTSPVTTESVRIDNRTQKVVSSKPAMGTLVSVSALGRSRDRVEEGVGRSLEEMQRLIGVFSRFERASAVSQLNDGGRLDGAPHEVCRVVSRSLDLHRVSSGAFDITVEPVVNLFRESLTGDAPSEPTSGEIAELLELVDCGSIEIAGGRIGFRKSGMGITLDGIAKGYIVDAMADVLRKHRISNYLINAGGDIRTAGTKEQRRPWTVAVKDPSNGGTFPDTIHLTDAAVATSGSYEIYFDRDKLFHHIVNSKSGRSPIHNASVSVVAPAAMVADALATSVFVMDPGRGIELIDSLPGCECLIIDEHGQQLKSTGWRSAAPIYGEKAEA